MKTLNPKFILFGFLIITTMIIALLTFSAKQVYQSSLVLETTIQNETNQTNWFHKLQIITDQRSFLLIKLIHENDAFERDELIQKLYQYGEDFMLTREKLLNSELNDIEKQLLKKQIENSTNTIAAQYLIIDVISNNLYEKAEAIFIHQALPLQQKNSKLLNKLVQIQGDAVHQTILDAEKQLQRNYLILILSGIIIIISSSLIALFVYRNMNTNIKQLSQTQLSLTETLLELRNQQYALDKHSIVSITDTAGYITYVNEKFCEVTQYGYDEVIGQKHNINNSGYHSRSFFRNMWTTIVSGKTWTGELKNQKKDGSYYWVESTIVPFLDKNNLPYQYIAIRTEITDIKNIEDDLKLSLEQLALEAERAQEANTLKSSIVSTMTHELRTPLNSILGYSQLLLLEKDSLTGIQIKNVDNIIESGNELLNSIDNILLYSKLKSQTIKLQPSYLELNVIIETVLAKITHNLQEGSVLPILTSDLLIDAYTDIKLLQKALLFIIDNAVKFTHKGHINISYQKIKNNSSLPAHPSLAKTDLILIIVEDTGIGIPSEKMQIIFDDFRQADEKDSRQFEGYGIGLTLAKSIIKLLGGEIWLTSEVGTGTRVYMTIPDTEKHS